MRLPMSAWTIKHLSSRESASARTNSLTGKIDKVVIEVK